MKNNIRTLMLASALAIGAALAAPAAQAANVTLTFGTLPSGVFIDNYFNGGLSSYAPSGTGPNDGIVFSSNIDEVRAGSAGKFEYNPSRSSGVAYFAYSPTVTSAIDVANGFNGISLEYSLLNNLSSYATTVDIWSGLNGTGALLGTLALIPGSTTVPCQSRSDEFCTWSQAADLDINGVAKSITVVGTNTKYIELDSVSVSEVPLPAALPLFGAALAGIGGWRLRRRQTAA